ncbi:Hypothetical protein A7982_07344 [Minicystis rosea]|nr:Hypothetical protein A7982_07344 [Minicystis rosea]
MYIDPSTGEVACLGTIFRDAAVHEASVHAPRSARRLEMRLTHRARLLLLPWGRSLQHRAEEGDMPKVAYWTRDGFNKSGNRGIAVVVDSDPLVDYSVPDDPTSEIVEVPFPEHFGQCVAASLAALYSIPSGRMLLETLDLTGERVSIQPASPSIGNLVKNSDQSAMLNPVAKELLVGASKPGAMTRRAVEWAAGSRNLNTCAQWLASRINEAPALPWPERGAPNFRLPYKRNAVEASSVAYWLNTGNPNMNPFNDEKRDNWDDTLTQHAKLATIIAVEKRSEMGSGSAATIAWNIFPDNPVNKQRPPAVGLAHELIHAYYSVRGEQCGYEVDHFSTVLFEYKCVGLGPWAAAPISENAVRAQWAEATVSKNDPLGKLNAVRPALRTFYGV